MAPVPQELLDILACPLTKVGVRMLSHEAVLRLNDAISFGLILYRDGTVVEIPLEEALITVDDETVYRVDDSIPEMLIDRGIPWWQLKGVESA